MRSSSTLLGCGYYPGNGRHVPSFFGPRQEARVLAYRMALACPLDWSVVFEEYGRTQSQLDSKVLYHVSRKLILFACQPSQNTFFTVVGTGGPWKNFRSLMPIWHVVMRTREIGNFYPIFMPS
jgi:hypothetical protein